MIIFKYSTKREIGNYFSTLGSINHLSNEKPKNYYIIKESGFDPDNERDVTKYFAQNAENQRDYIAEKTKSIENNWRKIEKPFFKKADEFFETNETQDNLTAFLTFNVCCGYNTGQGYFFVCFGRPDPNSNIIHEILHFYTHKLIAPEFKKAGLPYESFNDFKEALTFVMNYEFSEFLPSHREEGYEKQKKLIEFLESKYKHGMKANKVAEIAIKYLQ